MKTKTILIAAVMFFAFSVAAFAQATFTVGTIPVTSAVASGLTEKTGYIAFTGIGMAQAIDGVITINYGVPITVRGSVCANAPGCAGVPGVFVLPPDPLAPGVIQIAIDGPIAMPLSFRLSGTRVAVGGSGLTSLTASVSSTGNAIEVGTNFVPVIFSIQPGIGSFTVVTPPGTATFNSIFGGADQVAALRIREGFFNAFGPATDMGYTPSRATMIRLTLSSIPAGLQLTFPANAGAYFSRTDAIGVVQGSSLVPPDLVGTNTVYYMVTNDTHSTVLDNLDIGVTVHSLLGPEFPTLSVGSVTTVATFAPIGIVTPLSQPVPRYIDAPAGPVTIATVFPPAIRIIDFDGDAKTDITVLRPEGGVWYTIPSDSPPGTFTATQWGMPGDMVVPGDYDGDSKMDVAVWRPDTGTWFILPSDSPPPVFWATQWGLPTDIPFPGDYDGDGTTDIAVWRPDGGIWYVLASNTPGSYTDTQWGLPTDVPVPADYDGDGKTDIAVWRPEGGIWYILPSNTPPGTFIAIQWGLSTDKPVPGDYDGDGIGDLAVWRPSEGMWYILPSEGPPGTFWTTQWGVTTDIPVSGDYDGDGETDIAVWRPGDGVWYVLPSNSPPGSYTTTQWGLPTDVPISALTGILGALP